MRKPHTSYQKVVLVSIIIILSAGYFLYQKRIPTPFTRTNAKTLTYQRTLGTNHLSFKYPENFPVVNGKDYISREDQGISITTLDINDVNPSEWSPAVNKNSVSKYYSDLTSGTLSSKSLFSLWNLKPSDQIRQTKSGKYFRTSSTFSIAEECSVEFITRIEVPIDNKFILVNIVGNIDKIENSLPTSESFKKLDGCQNRSFTNGGSEKIWKLLKTGNGTPQAQEWYNTGEQIISSLDF